MKNLKENLLPVVLLYLSLMCLYVSYSFIMKDYNITKSIYQPYKTFVQLSSSHYRNVIITIIKGLAGLTGFGIYLTKGKKVNYFSTLLLLISIFELIIVACLQFVVLKDFSNYIDKTGIVISAVLFIGLSYFYFKDSEIKKLFPQIILSFFITISSYYLH
ncbi:hypothetical protein ASG22_17280 [Chryseobacterium sp. Leaf405]|uniref:hypothetical protein n=1 Tax=Chryseobacterium sp. Leaf405 TaxID=1736367 RepID=UPI0006F8ECA2|nr:hypothetical protein [Chryseobacterium sp. Leaf405]KQT33853.1 hypothetical protein ASG22_17280 [Chryseobacterium sp. Leaf405]